MKITQLSVYRPIAMSMIIGLIVLVGIAAFFGLPVDLFPELEFPTIGILINFEGAGPEEVENMVTIPVENALSTLPNLEEMRSTSRLGGALIMLEFDWGTDLDQAMLETRERMEMVRDMLPEESSPASILTFNPQDLPFLQLAVSSTDHDLVETKRIVENIIQPRIDSVEGVASVQIEGGREREVRMTFDERQLQDHDLSLSQIAGMLRGENINVPGGLVTDQNRQLPLRVTGELESIRDLEDFFIPTGTGEIIPLSALADIEQTYRPATVLSLLNGEPSVGMTIQKQADANTVNVGNAIHEQLLVLQEELPQGMSVATIFDQSLYIQQSIRSVGLNMVVGALLAISILFLFLRHIKSTLIIALAIPISIVSAFAFMFVTNHSLNLLTLGGLALGVGLMVDNAIVILENIYRYRQNGHGVKEAAIQGTKEVGTAVIASTLTTVIVFVPMIFTEGLAAQLFRPLALVVSLALLASLFTSFIIVPLLSSKMMDEGRERPRLNFGFERLQQAYKRLLGWSLHRPKKVALFIIALCLLSLIFLPFLGTEFLPHLDESIVYMTVSLPAGTALDKTMSMTDIVEEQLRKIPEIEHMYVSVGGVGQFQIGAGSLSHRANYTIPLSPVGERDRSDQEIATDIQQHLENIPGADIHITAGNISGFAGNPISLQIRGPDVDLLNSLTEDVMTVIEQVEGVHSIQSSFTRGQEEIRVDMHRFHAAQYGLSTTQVAQNIREANQGIIATQFSQDGEQLQVRLTINERDLPPVNDLDLIEIPTGYGFSVPLGQVTDIQEQTSPHTISRMNRSRQATVNAQLSGRDLGSAISEIRKALEDEISPPNGYSIHFSGQDEEMAEAFQQLSIAIALAVLLVYMVLAAQFESFYHPVLIISAVPLAMIGVFSGLFLTSHTLGVGALIGLLILIGIVVNNAIILVDYVNTLRQKGMSTKEALLRAGPTRLRPIMMTTLTTILGLFPLILGYGEGSEIQAPMATVVIGGLSLATLITLIFIPVMYYILDEWRRKRHERQEQTQ